jgi:peptide/nickel transport system substrate-binding protein
VPLQSPRRSLLRRLPAAAAVVVAASLALAACAGPSSSSSSTATASDGGTLNWASSYPPSSWDPVVNGSGASFRVTALAYASLTTTNAKGEAEPALAKSWDYNSDGTEVTFHLRSGLKFSDGSALDSTAVKDYIQRAQTQQNSALVGEGIAAITSIDTPNATDVVLHLNAPDYQIPLVLAERVGQITNPAKTAAELNKSPDGAGPFRVTSVVAGSHATFVKNPDYWDAKDIHIAKVEVFFGVNPTTVVSGLQTGVYNFADLTASQVKSAKSAGLDVVQQPGYNANNLSINTTVAPFTNPKVVEAIKYAVNREQIVSSADFGIGTPATQPFPKGYIAYDSAAAEPSYDRAKAKQLLSDAGYPNGFSVTLNVSADTAANELLQAQLKAVGINATLKVDPNWSTGFFAKQTALSAYGTTGRDSPIQTLQAHFGAKGVLNLSGVGAGTAFDAAVSKALATPLDSSDYAKNIQAATAAGMANTALVFTDTVPNLYAKAPNVSTLPKIPGKYSFTGVTIGK